jgi:hypothetical protein
VNAGEGRLCERRKGKRRGVRDAQMILEVKYLFVVRTTGYFPKIFLHYLDGVTEYDKKNQNTVK